jgi:hypothetical protein
VALAEGVAAGGEGDGLLVIHAHAGEGLANVAAGLERVGIAARAFRIDVDQTHLDGGQRVLKHHFLVGLDAGRGAFRADPLLLGAPVDVLLGLPDVSAAAAEAEYGPAHGFNGHIAGHDHQIRPGQLGAVLLLDGPQQAPGLVQIGVVRPAVQGCEALRARARAAAAVAGAVGAGRMPGHADEEGAVVAVVRRPPGLAVGHQGVQVTFDRIIVQGLESLGVVEVVAHGIAVDPLLMQNLQRKLVGPPITVGASQQGAHGPLLLHRATAVLFTVHDFPPFIAGQAATLGQASAKGKSINFFSSDQKIYGEAQTRPARERDREKKNGAPDRIRTCDPCLRRAVLYPAELRVRERAQGPSRGRCLQHGRQALNPQIARRVVRCGLGGRWGAA